MISVSIALFVFIISTKIGWGKKLHVVSLLPRILSIPQIGILAQRDAKTEPIE
jgi:hypothetical protein